MLSAMGRPAVKRARRQPGPPYHSEWDVVAFTAVKLALSAYLASVGIKGMVNQIAATVLHPSSNMVFEPTPETYGAVHCRVIDPGHV